MKKTLVSFLSICMLAITPAFAATPAKDKKIETPTQKSLKEETEKFYKFEWAIKKTGKVVITNSSNISFDDPLNKQKTGKIVFSPQKNTFQNQTYLTGLGLDMKLFYDKNNKPILGMTGTYTDPNQVFDFTEKMPDEKNVAHPVIQYQPVNFPNGQSMPMYFAKFMNAYDLSNPTGDEITFTRFIIKEPNGASLIEITFRVYEFDVPKETKEGK